MPISEHPILFRFGFSSYRVQQRWSASQVVTISTNRSCWVSL